MAGNSEEQTGPKRSNTFSKGKSARKQKIPLYGNVAGPKKGITTVFLSSFYIFGS